MHKDILPNILSVPFLFLGLGLHAEPFLAPDNPFLRHEIRLLQDAGHLSTTTGTWPLSLGGMSQDARKVEWGHDLLAETLARESKSGFSPLRAKLGLSDNRVTVRSFGSEPRANFDSSLGASWMNDRFAARLSLSSLNGVESDWKGRKDEGLALDGSYLAMRLGNWSGSIGKVGRWWGPGWDGSLIMSTNARPIPAVSLDRQVPEPFESKWLSWIGPWSFQSFIGRLEKERHVPKAFLWGMRVEFAPQPIDGLEIGMFRMMQLGGSGRPQGFETWVDAFLSQDNAGANTGNDPAKEPGNQLAGLDFRWRPYHLPIAFYGQVVGEDEDKFLPNALFFQYGIEAWIEKEGSTLRFYAEYADLTSTWWTDDATSRNVTYGHHIYKDGYRYRGRPIGHWADQDSQILSLGVILLNDQGMGWGGTLRLGDLNEDGQGGSSVSNGSATDLLSIEVYNTLLYDDLNLELRTSLGWESLKNGSSSSKDEGLTAYLSLTRIF
ncbi:MAG: hypothetical protein CMA37_03875 [Euryarchaeota archaeon]|nr:hypothetical protein [Euryarchaeota archaeon]